MRAALLLALTACALTSKARPLEIRYFSPEPAITTAKMVAHPTAPHAPLRLGRVIANGPARASIEHRDSAVELGRYDAFRWSEPPDAYVRRALIRALFERGRPLDQAIGGPGVATLDVEVIEFSEVRVGAQRFGRVRLRFELHDEHTFLARGAISVERRASGAEIALVVAAIGAAVDDACAQLAERVADRLVMPAPALHFEEER